MSKYICLNCETDFCDEPEVELILTSKILQKYKSMMPKFKIFFSGWTYKPEEISSKEWRMVVGEEQKLYNKWRRKILLRNKISFCSIECAINYLSENS